MSAWDDAIDVMSKGAGIVSAFGLSAFGIAWLNNRYRKQEKMEGQTEERRKRETEFESKLAELHADGVKDLITTLRAMHAECQDELTEFRQRVEALEKHAEERDRVGRERQVQLDRTSSELRTTQQELGRAMRRIGQLEDTIRISGVSIPPVG